MKYLFLLLGLFWGSQLLAENIQPLDSVGFQKIDGKYYVLHKVEKGQGLFGVARRYNTTVDEISKVNPEVKDGLKVGQVLKIPVDYKPEAKKEEKKEEKKEVKPETTKVEKNITHVVKTGETLYKIAQQYNVSVDQIKKLNNLNDNSISVGQELIIQGEKKVHTENYGGEESKPDPKKETVKPDNKPNNYEYNSATGEVKENGFAVVATDENVEQERSFALHPTAPVGTIIMVTNTENNKSVFVRVVGRYESKDETVVIKLTKASAARLGIEETSMVKVKLNYAK